MNTTKLVALSAIVFAVGTVMANDTPANARPLTRAEVIQSVLAARAAGQLLPAGEAADWAPRIEATSSTSRAEVKRDVIAARDAGQLRPAGEREEREVFVPRDGAYQLARAEVKAETLRARDAGELIPAGEGAESNATRVAHVSTRDGFALSRAARFFSFNSR